MIIIDDFPNDKEIREMRDDELLENYKRWVIINDGILLDRDRFSTISTNFGKIITRKTSDKRKEHRMKYKAYSDLLCHKIRVTQDEINKRSIDIKWWEDSRDDPLYNWFFKRMGKKCLIKIIEYLNKGENLRIKRSGTIPELRRRVMDYLPKDKRKEIISKILSEGR